MDIEPPPNPQPARKEVPPPLSRNTISFLGWVITMTTVAIMVILIAADVIFHGREVYNSLVTFLLLPGMLVFGVLLILVGVVWEWGRRHRRHPGAYPRLPSVDLNQPWQRRRMLIGLMFISVFFAASAVGTYQAYHFTESPQFCGLVCHQVMKPEYTAYQHSPHARVLCTECHIGSGAKWYVQSKMTGLHQVWAVATGTYKLPIETPVANLRPARGTCEECHWPDKFSMSMEKVFWHFAFDESNTASRTNLLLKVGGGDPKAGLGQGIHWHISPGTTVRYWARDRQRLDIPWVEVAQEGQPPRVYKTPDCPDPLPPGAEIRLMDCIDCHNRPSHIYLSPQQLVDSSLANGKLDPGLPYLKRYAVALLEEERPDTPSALRAIDEGLSERYADRMAGPRGAQLVRQNIEWLQGLYQENFFPEQRVDWREYPNNIGHFEFPGCYRCHDEKHASADRRVISNDCLLCHEFLDQAEGQAAYGPITYQGGPWRHPLNMGEIWRGRNCTDCHSRAGGRVNAAAPRIRP
jgi:hypothetical protein